jgi:hypothetical protein
VAGDRSPEQIQADIEAARESLAASLDQLVERTSPKRLADQGKQKAIALAKSPAGKAVIGAAGALVLLVAVHKFRTRR